MNRKEIVFHNRQRIGDMLMFTCGIRDFKKQFPNVKVNVIATAKHIFDHNPYIDNKLQQTDENLVKIGPAKGTNQSNRIDWHFANAYRLSMEEKLGCHIQQGESRPDVWLTQEEWDAPRVIEDPYWIICTNGEKGWGCKMYPHERFQEFVDQNRNVKFVHIGTKEDDAPRLVGENVIDYIGKTQDGVTGIRDLFKLFLNAEGSIGLVSFHMHLSAAFYKPAIVIAGAREPVSFTRYQGHAYLTTEGMLPCAETTACWCCNIDKCTNLVIGEGMMHKGEKHQAKVPKCVDLIPSSSLTEALRGYYLGGRLNYDIPSPKPMRFDNVVTTPAKVSPEDVGFSKELFKKYGLEWSFSCIPADCWEFICGKIHEHKVKTVLEFGAGISTLLMYDMGLKVITYETEQKWIDKIKSINPNVDVRLWDGHALAHPGEVVKFDMAFVDGPCSGENREFSVKIAAEAARTVIVHDGGRPFEMKWQNRYLREKFAGPEKGGKRSHFWMRKTAIESPQFEMGEPLPEKREIVQPGANSMCEKSISEVNAKGKKHIKIVSTARGWGGCARSVTTIMRRLLSDGHKVEFIPFRNEITSREFNETINTDLKGLIVSGSYDAIKGPCDVLFVYADDFVWEFPKPEWAENFSGCKADRKIMMVNYRRGKIGEVEWTKGWDKYMFLNSEQEANFLSLYSPDQRPITKVLPPCTELDPFFNLPLKKFDRLQIVRHNSQGDAKFAKDEGNLIDEVLNYDPDCTIDMLPGPSFYKRNGRFMKHKKTADPYVIAQFLSKGNLFWYSLPYGYMDMGPRVILEAMASGLPILADNWGGAPDRVTPECGWICEDKKDHLEILSNVTADELAEKGRNARDRARQEFHPERWMQEILT